MARVLSFNPDICTGCFSCEVACKQLHKLPVGAFRIKIEKAILLGARGKAVMKFNARLCNQCVEAPCIEVCPARALERDDEGVVALKADRCNGCRACIDACPLRAVWFNLETKKIEKCDTCAGKPSEMPFCVKHCMSGALRLELLT
ncbi:MAG: 4Fe-4S dicluster domain-containing protein [Candidatus Nezhaarchaeota archaeon]|nr:4Fe-4S dicluster domain-containing protein [Candidatus Nezhaarchaeota archaeon]